MKVTNTRFNDLIELEQNLELSNLDTQKTLVQVFSGLIDTGEIAQIQSIIKDKNKDINYIGVTTSGEIHNGLVFEETILVSILEFEHTTFSCGFFIHDDDYQLGLNIASSVLKDNSKAMFLYMDGIFTNGSDVIDAITSVKKDVPIAGGMAGDNGSFVQTYLFDKEGIYGKGAIAVALNSDVLSAFTDYQLNWQPIGKEMTVTKVEKNRLYEIDGIKADEIYGKYLGERVKEGLPFSATEFPLLKVEDELETCRASIKHFDDGSLLTIGNLEVGDKVKLAFGNINSILNATKNKIQEYKTLNPEVIFSYSCTARKSFLQSEVTTELEPLNEIAPLCGFFAYGELLHRNEKNSLLNMSLTMLALSESEKLCKSNIQTKHYRNNKILKNFMTDKHFLVLDALTTLSNTVIQELEDTKQQLKQQAIRDYLTGLYNRRYFVEVSSELISMTKRENKPLSVILLDIDKFKYINDKYGHIVGDKVIKLLSSILEENTRDVDITSRFGGEEFAIMLPLVDKSEAFKVAEKLRKKVEQQSVKLENEQSFQFTISLGVDSFNKKDQSINAPIDRADKALYLAKESGRNKTIVH